MQRLDRPRQALAMALAGLAGFVDATGFLSAHGYFVSFMSGNTTRLAVNLARDPAAALEPAALIAGFVLGVIGGALVAAYSGRWRKPLVLGLVTVLLGLAALADAFAAPAASLAAMVLAMGALNNSFQRDGEVAVGVTYMTGALVKLGQGIAARIAGRGGEGWLAHLLLWLGLAGGAVAGALAWQPPGLLNHVAACDWALLASAAAVVITRRETA